MEKLTNYLLLENKFFQCHQFELYAYLLAILCFVSILRDEARSTDSAFRISTALLPLSVLYVGYLIRSLQQLQLNVDTSQHALQLSAVVSYLLFIVGFIVD